MSDVLPSTLRRRRAMVLLTAAALVGLGLAWTLDRGPDGDRSADDSDDTRRAAVRVELAAEAWTLAPYDGVGAWVDVYDWTDEFTGSQPSVGLEDLDRMAEVGVDTVFIQTAHNRSAAPGVIEPDRLDAMIDRAHDRGLHVVAWVLPPLVDLDADLRRLTASAELPVDGLGVDIESVEVADVADRNRRLLELTDRLRAEVGTDKALAAITPSAVHLQVVNPGFWPGFPWPAVAAAYDVIQPMAYWSIRDQALRDGGLYVGDNMDRIRASTGDADIPIHPVGGIADGVSVEQVAGMVRAIQARGGPGGGLYDWASSNAEQWAAMAQLRADG
ncbi:MAG: hypothetical protein ABIX10_04565 [Acidimicrobiales bacterium]